MTSEGVIWLVLAIGGAAAFAGGLIFYRGSTTTGKRAAGAALMAAGVAMWLILVATIPVSVSDNASPEPDIVFQK